MTSQCSASMRAPTGPHSSATGMRRSVRVGGSPAPGRPHREVLAASRSAGGLHRRQRPASRRRSARPAPANGPRGRPARRAARAGRRPARAPLVVGRGGRESGRAAGPRGRAASPAGRSSRASSLRAARVAAASGPAGISRRLVSARRRRGRPPREPVRPGCGRGASARYSSTPPGRSRSRAVAEQRDRAGRRPARGSTGRGETTTSVPASRRAGPPAR